MRPFLFALLFGALLVPTVGQATAPDLAFSSNPISLSTSTLYAGDTVRIYARLRNLGDVDMTAVVYFYQGSNIIDTAQAVSIPAGGATEEVFVDLTVPSGSFNIRAVIAGAEPNEVNVENNEVMTALYTPILDDDRDGVANSADNCQDVSNANQLDTDDDGAGDACDNDDDNDRWSDAKEADKGTDPLDTDTDNDGDGDASDGDPLHAPTPVAEPAIVAPTSTATSAPATQSTTQTSTTSVAETTAEEVAEEELTVSRPTTAYGILRSSPLAQFTYVQEDWNSFTFQVINPEDGNQYSWDFGDGASSTEVSLTRDYTGPGTYEVVLTTTNPDGGQAIDSERVAVPFFSLENPWIQAAVAFLGLLLFALCLLLFFMRRRANEDEV